MKYTFEFLFLASAMIYKSESLTYDFSPSFIELNEDFLQTCSAVSGFAVLTREQFADSNDICMVGCDVWSCGIDTRATYNCTDSWIHVYIKHAEQEDFTQWTCSSEGIEKEQTLSLFVAVSLTPSHTPPIIENKEHTFTCEASGGNPGALIRWHVDGELQDEGVEQVNSTDTQTSYLTLIPHRAMRTVGCIADQVHNKPPVYGENITINVLYPPGGANTTTPEVIVLVDENAKFECVIDGVGNPDTYTFIWTRDNDDDFRQQTDSGVLDMPVTSVEQEDTYHCTPENTVGPGRPANITLTVGSQPQLVNPPLSPGIVFYNHSLSVDCVVEGKPAFTSIEWDIPSGVHDIYKSTDLGSIPEGKLTRHTVRLEWNTGELEKRKSGDQMEVTCVASNGVGSDINHRVTMDVQYEPSKEVISLDKKEIFVEDKLLLTCNGNSGNPESQNHKFTNNKGWSETSHNSFQLLIHSVTQEAEYSCAAINYPDSYPGGLSGPMSESEGLTVLVEPYIFHPTSDIETKAVYNEDYSLECEVTGKPRVEVTWLRDDSIIPDGDFRDQNDTDISLTDGPYDLTQGVHSALPWIKQGAEATCDTVTKYDGHYRCVGKNNDNKENSSAAINLVTQYPPIWFGQNITNAEVNKSTTIKCSICAQPMPVDGSYTWYKDGRRLDSEKNQQILIEKVTKEDIGIYTCESGNGIDGGSRNYSINVTETGPPIIQELRILENKTSSVAPLYWEIVTDGGYGPLVFSIFYKDDTMDFQLYQDDIQQYSPNITVVDVVGLQANTWYDFKVRAENNRSIDAFSGNISNNGNTTYPPSVQITSVDVEDGRMNLEWSCCEDTFHRKMALMEVQVTLCFNYREDGKNGDWTTYPGDNNCSIPAIDKACTIHDKSLNRKTSYEVIPVIYENGFLGTQAEDGGYTSVADPKLDPGDKAAAAVAPLLFIALVVAVVGFLMYRRNGKQPTYGKGYEDSELSSEPEERPRDETYDNLNEEAVNDNIHKKEPKPVAASIPLTDSHSESKEEAPAKEEPIVYADIDVRKLPQPKTEEKKPVQDTDVNLVYADLAFQNQQNTKPDQKVQQRKPPTKKTKPIVAAPKAPETNIAVTADRISLMKQFIDVDDDVSIKASFNCSDPSRVLTWKYNDEPLTHNPASGINIHHTDKTSELMVTKSRKEQSGKYTFEVSGQNGSAEVVFYVIIIGRIVTTFETEDGLVELSEPNTDDEDDFEYFGDLPSKFML